MFPTRSTACPVPHLGAEAWVVALQWTSTRPGGIQGRVPGVKPTSRRWQKAVVSGGGGVRSGILVCAGDPLGSPSLAGACP